MTATAWAFGAVLLMGGVVHHFWDQQQRQEASHKYQNEAIDENNKKDEAKKRKRELASLPWPEAVPAVMKQERSLATKWQHKAKWRDRDVYAWRFEGGDDKLFMLYVDEPPSTAPPDKRVASLKHEKIVYWSKRNRDEKSTQVGNLLTMIYSEQPSTYEALENVAQTTGFAVERIPGDRFCLPDYGVCSFAAKAKSGADEVEIDILDLDQEYVSDMLNTGARGFVFAVAIGSQKLIDLHLPMLALKRR